MPKVSKENLSYLKSRCRWVHRQVDENLSCNASVVRHAYDIIEKLVNSLEEAYEAIDFAMLEIEDYESVVKYNVAKCEKEQK